MRYFAHAILEQRMRGGVKKILAGGVWLRDYRVAGALALGRRLDAVQWPPPEAGAEA